MNWAKTGARFLVLILGLFGCGLGMVFTVQANLGVSPWDVFHLGVTRHSLLTVGRVQQITGLVIILITVGLTRRIPRIGTFMNMLGIGFFVDQIRGWQLIPAPQGLPLRIAFLLTGIACMGIGSGVYLSAKLGAGPRDGLMLYLSQRTGQRIRVVKTVMEVSAVVAGYVLGGPVGMGTVIVSLGLGPVMEFCIHFFGRLLGFLTESQSPAPAAITGKVSA